MPAQRMQVAIQQSISICRGVIFNPQCFVNGFQKSLVDILSARYLTLVRCFSKQAQKAIRHTQGCCGHCFIVHGLSSVLMAVRGRGWLAVKPLFVSLKWLACCKVYSFAIVCTGQINLIFAIVTAASLGLPKFVLL